MTSQKRILVVEDNQMNRMLLANILSPEYIVLEAENGEAALAVLKEYGEGISLILLDIVMPVMDGYTFLSIVKANPDYSSIPVIVTTQSDGESDEVSALAHGAADFVAKPYKTRVILHRVASIINLRETAAMINLIQYDKLTGLYSKEFFYQRVRERLARNPDKEYDIVCSDIENFKLINDIFGIPAGDKILRGVAELYSSLSGDMGVCGRLNADQFVCLLERRAFEDWMFINAHRTLTELDNAQNIVMKWGIYQIGDKSISVEQMCDRAILAARSIKGKYGKFFATYDDKLRNKLLREQAITDGMEAALAQNQFEIYLQPKYRLKDNALAGAEALVRWNHPEWGLQSPAEFIPLFERNGFITKLDRFVWDRTCAVLREWRDKGYPSLPVSVNVSRADIYNADLVDILIETIQKYDLEPSCLHLEITESAYTEDPDQIVSMVSSLREFGFIIEMDDFGSGYSSLNMLNKMPIDILKLDMNFIQSETAKPTNQGILHFIMSLARWMNLKVVAEGVETQAQLGHLQQIGCDYVQGYYFAKPMPCHEFDALMKRENAKKPSQVKAKKASLALPDARIILVADEDLQYRQEVKGTFEEEFQIVEAADAKSVLRCAEEFSSRIAAVIFSATLPDLNSNEALEDLKNGKESWDFPVIVTAPWDVQMEANVLMSGAEDFAGKPHLQSSLWKRTKRAIALADSKKRERELKKEACHDYLTGLLNRRGLELSFETTRDKDMTMAFYLFDLDNLKQINDTFGHMKGDLLIKAFSQVLRAQTRKTDILARYGGDEFVVIMKHMNSQESAFEKGREICEAIKKSGLTGSMPAACTAGAVLCGSGDSIDSIIAKADKMLYQAKVENKGGCCLWKE